MDNAEDAPQVKAAIEQVLSSVADLLSKRRASADSATLKANTAVLKAELKEFARYGTVDKRRREKTKCEASYFYPAVWRSVSALSLMSAATNPGKPQWVSTWQDVHNLFQERLDQLRKELPEVE